MKNHNLSAHIVWATLIIMAMLAYAGCYNDAPNPWYNNQENTGGNTSNKTPGTQQGGSGGTQQNGAGGGTQQDPSLKNGHKFVFKIPENWRYNGEGTVTTDQLIIDQPSSDGIKSLVTMDLSWVGLGDDAKAKKLSQEDENRLVPWTDEFTNKEYKPYYKEMDVNGTKVYIAGDINIAWGTPSWAEKIWFSRDGDVYNIVLDDVVEKHLDSVKTVITSIKRKN